MRGLKGKNAVVTGGSTGIGLAIAYRLVEEGVRVLLMDRNGTKTKEEAKTLQQQGYNVSAYEADITDEIAVEAAMAYAQGRFGGIDILVNNAAVLLFKGIDADQNDWQNALSVNVTGTALCVKHAVPVMRQSGGGAIINIGSISGATAQPAYLTYSATKGALSSMTRCMALDLASDGIRVNEVSPGIIWSEATARITQERFGLDRRAADLHPDIGGRNMLNRVGDPEEVAAAVAFLASDDARFITATNLYVDGGFTAI